MMPTAVMLSIAIGLLLVKLLQRLKAGDGTAIYLS
jgi:hypothetical protein